MSATDPSNAEVLATLRVHMEQQQQANRAQTEATTEIKSQMSEMRGSISTLANKQLEFEQRLSRSERATESTHRIALSARESHSDLEGVVMREVGQLATAVSVLRSDSATQNKTLAGQDRVLAEQSATLDKLEKSDIERSARESAIYFAVTKGLPALWAVLLALAGAVAWFLHSK